MTDLDEFLTVFTGSSFNFGEPIYIEYLSTAVFDSTSTVVPSVEILDELLSTAFEGENLNGFIGMLQSLPPGNVFSTTIFVSQVEAGQTESSSSSQRQAKTTATAGVVAGASAIILLLAGFVYYKKQDYDEEEDACEFKKSDACESLTVSGETYTGAWSIDQTSEANQSVQAGVNENGDESTKDDDAEDESDEDASSSFMGCSNELVCTDNGGSQSMAWGEALRSISLS